MKVDPFPAGCQVKRQATGERGIVLDVISSELRKVGFPGAAVTVHVDELTLATDDPVAALSAGDIGESALYLLGLQSNYLKHAYRYDPLSGLTNARIEPELHQVFVAHRVMQKLLPRMILADEVGLGKTIEAGLVIKELRAREMINRVLVVCPASLQLQWQQELSSKFNESFQIMDGVTARAFGKGDANPWSRFDSVIASLPFAATSKRAEQIVEAGWDLVVFDEAHRVRRRLQGRKPVTTQAYRMADELKELVDGVLMLTATPMQLHQFELYSLIELVEPGLFRSFQDYDRRRQDLPVLNEMMRCLQSWNTMSPHQHEAFLEAHAEDLQRMGISTGNANHTFASDEGRKTAMGLIADRHPLSRVMVRNRKSVVGIFSDRRARQVLVALSDEEKELYEDITTYIREVYNAAVLEKRTVVGLVMVGYQKMLTSSSAAIRASLKKRRDSLRAGISASGLAKPKALSESEIEVFLDSEEPSSAIQEYAGRKELEAVYVTDEIELLGELVERLDNVEDSKISELLVLVDTIFEEFPDEKLIIFTQFIETQLFLRDVLEGYGGYRCSIFNGRMNLEDKERAVKAFRTEKQVMISTESGGEGRNFQFCHLMVNYDLPWNPMKVEQRIGRLDRIGQTKPVFIYNLACAGTIEERVLDVLSRRIGLFKETVGSLDPILGSLEQDIQRIVMSDIEHYQTELSLFERELEERVREAREKERTLADFALDYASLRHDEANALLKRSTLARPADLRAHCSRVLDFYGGMLDKHSEGGLQMTLPPDLASRLRSPNKVIRGAFDPVQSMDLEELDFFAFGHPVVNALVDLPLAEEVLTGCRRDPAARHEVSLEIIYEHRGVGVRPEGILMRHEIGPDLVVHSEELGVVPAGEPATPPDPLPAWIDSAAKKSDALAQDEHMKERERIYELNEKLRIEELERADQVFEYRRIRLEQLIGDAGEWISTAEKTGTEKERRILPARRGKLAKDRERLAQLEYEHEQKVAEIRARRAGVDTRVLAAGLVMR